MIRVVDHAELACQVREALPDLLYVEIRIHRGARHVGGTCVEVAVHGVRIVLDAGLPMGETRPGSELLPDVPGLWGPGDDSLLGVLISHAHPDHMGLIDLVDSQVPVYLGARATAICRETRFFVPAAIDVGATRDLVDGVPVALGPFTVTPFAVDHGIDDAFAILVEADGQGLLYSGDFRGHGRDPGYLERLATRVGRVDVLLLEGTRIGSGNAGRDEISEHDVEELCAERFAAARRCALAFASGQNLDRVETIARAARRAGRTPVLDLYGASIWTATGRPWPCEARVRLSHWQRRHIIERESFDRVRAVRQRRIYDDELARRSAKLVIIARTSALEELENLGVLIDGDAVWSMWPGYLTSSAVQPALRILRRNGVVLHQAHASGHACPRDLRRLVDAVKPRRVVPVHCAFPEAMAGVVGAAELHGDGEWWKL